MFINGKQNLRKSKWKTSNDDLVVKKKLDAFRHIFDNFQPHFVLSIMKKNCLGLLSPSPCLHLKSQTAGWTLYVRIVQ